MASSSPIWLQHAVQDLTDRQSQRVWSVIVSLFGDLAQGPGDRVSSAAVSRIIQPMGIRPEAIRVALHRLRKDNWLDSRREGRASVHFLTDHGRGQSVGVSPRIYARDPAIPERWHLLLGNGGQAQEELEELRGSGRYLSLGRTACIGPGRPPGDLTQLAAFDVTPRAIPDWASAALYPPAVQRACVELETTLRRVRALRAGKPPPDPWATATLRTLIVHRWRRVVLRHPDLPPVFWPPGWAGLSCRHAVCDLLDGLPRPQLSDLERDLAA